MTVPVTKHIPEIDPDLFWSKVAQGCDDECWLWQGYVNDKGYGRYAQIYAHRIAYYLNTGEQPVGIVRHSCDTPLCCNAAHLLTGTLEDNVRDRHVRGRNNHPTGTKNPRCKLTETQVREIKQDSRRPSVLGKLYGVTPEMIYRIRKGLAWTHIK